MNRKRLGYILMGSGLALSLIVGVVVYLQVQEAERVKASLPKAKVVIAAADIPARSDIAAAMLRITEVPDELVQIGAATKAEDVVGKFTPVSIVKGEVINLNRIGPAAAKSLPSFKIERGKVMYVMPVDFGQTGKPFGLAKVNAIRAGDRVDLLYSTVNLPQGLTAVEREAVEANPVPFLQTRIMLQNLRIQEIGSYAADGSLISATGDPATKEAKPTTDANIIFIVSPEEALVLKWLRDSASYYKSSNVEMVLRSPADEEQADPNLLVNFNYMREKYNLAPPPPNLSAAGR